MSKSLADTMPATQVGATSLAQVAFVAAAMVSEVAASRVLLVVLHLLLAGIGAVTLRWRLPAPPFMGGLYALITFDFATARTVNEPIVTVAFATFALTALMPVMLYRGRWPALASATVTPAVLVCLGFAHPGVDRTLITAIITTNATLLVAAVTLMSAIRRFGDRADQAQQEAAAERQRAVRSTAAIAVAVEDARTLHDTVINTLGALARGAPRLHDRALVRERCRQDAERVGALLTSEADRQEVPWWLSLGRPGSVEVRRRGLPDEQLSRYAALLPPAVAHAVQGCVEEAIQNAAKHSGADHVDVNISVRSNEFAVEVADAGVGFDGRVAAGRGLAESVLARAKANGIHTDLRTAPGAGTRITLAYRLGQANASGPDEATTMGGDVVAAMRRSSCWTWAWTIIGAGVITETINRRGHLSTAHIMLLLVAALAFLAWWTCRGGKDLPQWLTAAIVLGAPGACVLAYWAVDFGWDQAFLLQTAALTPLFVILLVLAARRRPLVIALTLMIVAIAVPAAFHPGPGIRPMVVVVAMSIPLFALLGSWYFFYRGLQVFGDRFAQTWHRTQQTRHDMVAKEAADAMRRRWNAAGLESSVNLLHTIADGDVDPADPSVRQRCLDEETYLREITYLVPDQSPMSWWLALALAEARTRQVRIHLQMRTITVDDAGAAEAFGRLVLACVRSVQPEESLVVSLFAYHGDTRLFVVSSDPELAKTLPSPPADCRIRLQTTGRQTALEARWTGPTEPSSSTRAHAAESVLSPRERCAESVPGVRLRHKGRSSLRTARLWRSRCLGSSRARSRCVPVSRHR